MTLPTILSLPNDLQKVKEEVYDSLGFEMSHLLLHPESVEYGACSFRLNGHALQHRVAKITPTKTGQFVTIWKRNAEGITQPFDILDDLDFILITTKKDELLGQFIFPKAVLAEKGIFSQNGKEGKRGFRVYPPWDIATSKQAEKTQHWQTRYFLIIETAQTTNLNLAKQLFGMQANTAH